MIPPPRYGGIKDVHGICRRERQMARAKGWIRAEQVGRREDVFRGEVAGRSHQRAQAGQSQPVVDDGSLEQVRLHLHASAG